MPPESKKINVLSLANGELSTMQKVLDVLQNWAKHAIELKQNQGYVDLLLQKLC